MEIGNLSALCAVLQKLKYVEMMYQVIGYFGVEQIFPSQEGERTLFVLSFVLIWEKIFQDFFLIQVLWERRERREWLRLLFSPVSANLI